MIITLKSKIPKKKVKKLRLRRKKNQPEQIIIDREQGLIFNTENELFSFFQNLDLIVLFFRVLSTLNINLERYYRYY